MEKVSAAPGGDLAHIENVLPYIGGVFAGGGDEFFI